MSKIMIKDWKDWDSYEDIVSAVQNVQDNSITQPKIMDQLASINKEQYEELISDHSPFFAIGGTTAYDKDINVKFENIEDETMACMEAVQGI